MGSEKTKFKRVLLKISGEGLCKPGGTGLDIEAIQMTATQIKQVHDLNVQVGVVVGGGNIIRGSFISEQGVNRSTADYMGMLATVINGLALQDALEQLGVPTRVQSAVQIHAVAESYILRKALRHMEKGRVVIFAAGTGNTHFTTDTAAAQRAIDTGAEILMKATKVDGVYDKDPVKHTDAKRYDQLSYMDVLNKELRVMDSTAASLCKENNMPILVFNLGEEGGLVRAVCGETIGTLVN